MGFAMKWSSMPKAPTTVKALSDSIQLQVTLSNTGSRDGDEVVFIFHQPLVVDAKGSLPTKQLIAFERATLAKSASTQISFTISASQLGLVDNSGSTLLFPGLHALLVSRGHGAVLSCSVTVQGQVPIMIKPWL